MKKLSILLALTLVLALAAPAMADNVEITGDVTTTFEIGDYGDDAAAAADLWADGDVLDDPDAEDYPAKKRFQQEIGFNITGNVSEDITFDLALDSLYNQFTTEEIATGAPGAQGESNGLEMDTALLTLNIADSTIKLGDMNDYSTEVYFVDEEDLEGMEVSTAVAGYDVKAFVTGSEDFADSDFYGVTATNNLEFGSITGKYYTARDYNSDDVTNIAVAVEGTLTDTVTGNFEYVINDAKDADGDSLISAGVTNEVSDVLTVNANVLMVGEDFIAVADDLDGTDYDEYEVGAEYALSENTTVGGTYTMLGYNNGAGTDEDTIELTLANTNGPLTTDVAFETTTEDDADDTKTNVFTVESSYVVSDATTLNGKFVNKSVDNGIEYNYIVGGVDHKLADNVNWNTEVQLIDGEDSTGTDAEGNSLTTELSVSF